MQQLIILLVSWAPEQQSMGQAPSIIHIQQNFGGFKNRSIVTQPTKSAHSHSCSLYQWSFYHVTNWQKLRIKWNKTMSLDHPLSRTCCWSFVAACFGCQSSLESVCLKVRNHLEAGCHLAWLQLWCENRTEARVCEPAQSTGLQVNNNKNISKHTYIYT